MEEEGERRSRDGGDRAAPFFMRRITRSGCETRAMTVDCSAPHLPRTAHPGSSAARALPRSRC